MKLMKRDINEEYDDIKKAYNHMRNLNKTIKLSPNNANLESSCYELEKVMSELEDYPELD
jgi:hypothetical protein